MYQYSLQFFLDIFHSILVDNPGLNGVKDYQKRLDVITSSLFEVSYERVARGMLHDDRMVFGMLLCRYVK